MKEQDQITALKGIGDKTAALYNKAGVFSLWDLLMYLPRDYMHYPPVAEVRELIPGKKAAIEITIASNPAVFHFRGKSVLNAVGKDDSGSIKLVWYNAAYLKNNIHVGLKKVFFGRTGVKGDTLTMEHPKMYSLEEYKALQGKPESIYPLVKGLTNANVNKAVKSVFKELGVIEDHLLPEELDRLGLMELDRAIRLIHEPDNTNELIAGRKRLVFDEFLRFILAIRSLKEKNTSYINELVMERTDGSKKLTESLPYSLTKSQEKAFEEVLKDFKGEKPMNRLIEGDVGSGKTIVALLALVTCVENSHQGALMAPTEVLAVQHFNNITSLVEKAGLDITPLLLTGSMTAKQKREAREKIVSGEADIIIGTHALIQQGVEFKDLALVITDEQHRFGVNQRSTLSEKAEVHPHVLVMSATPIPRTLAIILYGDLDISVMDEKPAKRLPIKNALVDIRYRKKAYEFFEKEVGEGHQGYIICSQIEPSEVSGTENVEEYFEKLKFIFGDRIRLAKLHGKMKQDEKNDIMTRFASHEIDVLLSTTVVEVGVDVPNATVMMIEDAQRFGLAQLHQLRGRIGRGDAQSYCIFVDTSGEKENKRLEILKKTNDGFEIASEDLKLRGPGDMFGVRQSGEMNFKIADIYNDADMLKAASEFAETLSDERKGALLARYEERFVGEDVVL
ncbi:MAG: ATP-dependent DNA helicase RecG [Lachnospiraceae bacterium]|nr:ATP-dependent DNA helicase RecG [Lachnospiraceae bacterium]